MVGKIVELYTPKPVRRVTGESVAKAFGGSADKEPISRDAEFILCNPSLAIKLHWTAGIQELRKGTRAGGSVIDQAVRDKRVTDVNLLREADTLINHQLFRLPTDDRQAQIDQIQLWADNFPVLPSDFSITELETLATFADSMLVRLYAEHLPGRLNPDVIGALGNLMLKPATNDS